MIKIKIAAALLPFILPSLASAAPTTCHDLLIRSPERTYNCRGTIFGPIFELPLTFAEVTPGGPRFSAIFGEIPDQVVYTCKCDSKGKVEQPIFQGAKTFSCSASLGVSASGVFRGKVGGKDGSKILNWEESDSVNDANAFGDCVLAP